MRKVANLNDSDKRVLFLNTAEKMRMHPSIVEKDFWVCYVLDYLFNRCKWKRAFVFKGGTSLSKAYHVIDRFSEDIDLILVWRYINHESNEPWIERSKTQQDKLNKQMNAETAKFLKNEFVPTMIEELRNELITVPLIQIDANDPLTVNFIYPQLFEDSYLRSEVRLEIGPLAEWMPHHKEKIKSYVAEQYTRVFLEPSTFVNTIDVERTFWEKTTILHKIANRDINKPFPMRYARHYYDLFCMYNSNIKEKAFIKKELLEQDIKFKKKFYASNHSGYETAMIGSMMLMPRDEDLLSLKNDYEHMKKMLYGTIPDFKDILFTIKILESEINDL